MFDNYLPKETFHCPDCGDELVGWQGKEGPCLLLTWVEGEARPIPHEHAKEQTLRNGALRIYTFCRVCPGINGYERFAIVEGGVWTRTERFE